RNRQHRMKPEGWITQKRDVDAMGFIVLRGIEAAVAIVLAEARAVADRLAQSHMMKEPVRPARPSDGQGGTGRAQRSAEEIAFVIPIAKVTAQESGEEGLDVGGGENVRIPDPIARVIAASAASIGPEITLRSQLCEIIP